MNTHSNLHHLSAIETAQIIKNKEISPLEVFDSHVELIERFNPILNAAVEMNFEKGRELAKKYSQDLLKKKDLPPLYGVPFTCKEMLAVKNFKSTAGSVYYKDRINSESATVVERIENAGAILLATTNVPEFGFWFETNNQVYGRTSNPYNEKKTCGGSSGGEGALIGLGASPFGLGSDIGGSVRIPAAYCGVFAHKASSEIIPLTGHFPYSKAEISALSDEKYPMTTVGPLARSAKDLLPLIQLMMGPDQIDPKCSSWTFDFKIKKPKKIFYIPDPLIHGASPVSKEVKTQVIKSAEYLKEVGYEVEELSNDFFIKALDLWFNELNQMDRLSFSDLISPNKKIHFFSEATKMILGKSPHTFPNFILSILDQFQGKSKEQYFQNSQHQQERIRLQLQLLNLRQRFNNLLNNENVLLFPSQPKAAPEHNVLFATPFDFIYCGIFNALKNPSTQVPVGMSKDQLPLGIQVIAPFKYDHLSISIGEELEQAFGGWTPPQFK
ncbi:MAG: amidase [Bdellovibrionaceae bacterium]|nr:amidase [Pseudobdellovibrionaceae bacterium]NUM60013.1 amidase [Pseudobdellovibrionaceae bacterium]